MKTFILSADVGATAVAVGDFVMQDGSGNVVASDTATSEIGFALTSNAIGTKVGIVKEGLVTVPLAKASQQFNFGDLVEMDTGGQRVKPGATTPIGSVAKTKLTTVTDVSLDVFLSIK